MKVVLQSRFLLENHTVMYILLKRKREREREREREKSVREKCVWARDRAMEALLMVSFTSHTNVVNKSKCVEVGWHSKDPQEVMCTALG